MNGQLFLSNNGERWPNLLAGSVVRFEYEAGINRASRALLTIHNESLTAQNHELLGEGSVLTVQFGAADRTVRRTVRIHQLRGTDLLTIPAYGAAADLGDTVRWRLFRNTTYSEVAATIARSRGLQTDVQPDTVRRPQVAQAGETDGRLLARTAAEIGWEFWVDDATLHFRPPDYSARPALILTRGANLSAFDPQEQTLMAPGEMLLRTFNVAAKTYTEVLVNEWSARRTLLGAAALRIPEAGRFTTWSAVQDQAAGMAAAHGAYEALERTAVTARFQAGGDVRLMPGALVQVSGYGTRWDGLYRVALARHQVAGESYMVEGVLHRNAAGLVGAVRRASGNVNDKAADTGRPIATVMVVNMATGELRKEEIR